MSMTTPYTVLVAVALAAMGVVAATSTAECHANVDVHHFRLGRTCATVVSDGPCVFADNLFSAPASAVYRAYVSNFRAHSPTTFGQNVLLLNTPHGKVLVDTGSLSNDKQFFAHGGRLMLGLKSVGIDAESIRYVLLTHGHPDHVTGLVDDSGHMMFPNATVFISETDHKFWSDPPVPFTSPIVPDDIIISFKNHYLRCIQPYADAGQLELVPENGYPLPGIQLLSTPGHSPGHCAVVIEAEGEEQLIVTGDAWTSKEDQVHHPDWSLFFESHPTVAYDSRVELMQRLADKRTLALVYHEAFPGLGHVVQDGGAFNWLPITHEYELDPADRCP